MLLEDVYVPVEDVADEEEEDYDSEEESVDRGQNCVLCEVSVEVVESTR